ncbi:MAG: hypothetical protein FJ290_25200 [Planctomycetes bacterium]|nr:hypothetical protein [Planctomycetota bacterium]
MSSLTEYVRTKQDQQKRLANDAARVREEWSRELEALMAQLDRWLAPAVAAGLKLVPSEITVSEQALGSYQAPARTVELAGNQVAIRPVARIIVGGHGRVDVEGENGSASLIYWKPEARWMIVKERDWHKRVPLTEETFEALMEEFL